MTEIRRVKTAYCEVITQQLHDESAVFVRVFIQRVQLSNRLIKSLDNKKPDNEPTSQTRL